MTTSSFNYKSLFKYFALFLLSIVIISCETTGPNSESTDNKNDDSLSLSEKHLNILNSKSDIDSIITLSDKFNPDIDKESSEQKAYYYSNLGVIYYQHSLYEEAGIFFNNAQENYALLKDSARSNHMRMNMAAMKELNGNYKDAVEIYLDVIEYFYNHNDSHQLANAYSNLGVAYEQMELAKKSIEYHKKALDIRLEIKDTINVAYSYNNIGVVFTEIIEDIDSALVYYQKAYEIFSSKTTPWETATTATNIGHIYLKNTDFKKAENHFNVAYQIFDSLNIEQGMAETLRSFGQLYFAQGNDDEAIKALKKSLNLNLLSGNKNEVIEINKILSKIYIAKGNFSKAIEIMQMVSQLDDSLLNIEKQKTIAEMETKYQVKEKNKTIEVLRLEDELDKKRIRNQTTLIALLTVIFGLLIILFFIRSRQHILKQKQLRIELQNYILRVDEMRKELEKKDVMAATSTEVFSKFDLSDREIEVLKLITKGYKNMQIAEHLFISQNTVKTHIKNIYLKLDVKNRVEALTRINI